MKNKFVAVSAAVAVEIAFLAFYSGSAMLSGAFGGTLAYIFGWLCAVGVLKVASCFLPDSSAEEESLPTHFPVKGDLTASLLALGLLLCGNFAAFFISGTDLQSEITLGAVLVGVFVKPYCEETFFRYGMLSVLIRYGKFSRTVSVTVSALMFALIHPTKSLPFALFAGIVLGILATRHSGKAGLRRGAVCTFAVHAVYNLILYLVLYLVSL